MLPGLPTALGLSAALNYFGAQESSRSASKASGAQLEATRLGIEEQRRQFEAIQKLLSPYVQGGNSAFKSLLSLSGLGGDFQRQQDLNGRISEFERSDGYGDLGDDERASAIDQIRKEINEDPRYADLNKEFQRDAYGELENSPEFQSIYNQGENAILQNASATGGLRGGNTQRALSQYRPEVLRQIVQQRYQNLGGIAGMGQSSAAGSASAAQNFGNNAANLYAQGGAAQAGGYLAQGQNQANMYNNIGSSILTGALLKRAF